RASDFMGQLGQDNNPDWKTVAYDELNGHIVPPCGSVGFRWGESGQWNIEQKTADGQAVHLRLSLLETKDEVASVGFPYFGGSEHPHFTHSTHDTIQRRNVPVKKITLADGSEVFATTVFDLLVANYGIDRGLGGANVASSYDEDVPYTPAWQEKITGVTRKNVIAVAREFAVNAEKTRGRSMVILGAGINHWYHMDMNYRGIINMLMMCGCIGQSGGGWAHYVGQEKLRPQTGWLPLAFALDWKRPPRQMNNARPGK
ncbi:MAG: narG, partial [Methylococcaceae bacterium NSP1-1]